MQISMKIKLRKNFSRGFSLVELIVSISIITLLLGVVIFSYRTSTDKLTLNSGAQEMSIAIRQAEVYGLSVKEATVSSGNFQYGYGIYFNPITSPNDYYLYVDKNSNNTYDAGNGCGSGSTECVEKFSLRNNIQITGICKTVSSVETCYSSGTVALDVKFLRPDPIANIRLNLNSVVTSIPKGKVVLTSPLGATTGVSIESTGQILVQ